MGELACTFSERFYYLGERMPGPRFAKSSKTRHLAANPFLCVRTPVGLDELT
jgi:hypothetical protein